jgi:hypothetical protein
VVRDYREFEKHCSRPSCVFILDPSITLSSKF